MRQVNADRIVERARRETGLDRFESESFREGLEIAVADVNKAGWPQWGLDNFEEAASHLLGLRLKIDDYLRQHPQALETPVKAPVIVMGMPRTGTTLSSNLLATDPNRRSLLTWVADDPVPPPTIEGLRTDPRALAALELERRSQAEDPAAGRFYMSSAVFPTECISVLSQDFKSMHWEALGRLPAYSEWIWSADMTSAYDHHRRFLQVLQHAAPGPWNLKMPSHAMHLRYVLKAYPDARLVWTHRDPYTAVGSICSVIANVHLRAQDKPDDAWIAEFYPRQLAEHARRIMVVRAEIGRERVYDLHYARTMRDPIGSMRDLYAWLGDDFTAEAQANMRRWLQENPQGKWGKHAYKLDRWGLSEQKLAPLFADYLASYDVEREG
ncbi:MAG: sulfotransferase [Caulobacteraceae bacterium]|nr:sulfotransferase [Caulobacteraceae bacterium]